MIDALDNIPRSAMPAPERFRHDHILAQRPLVIRGLFADQPIDSLRTLSDMRRQLGGMGVEVRDEYTARGQRTPLSTQTASCETMTLGGYLDLIDREPDTTRLCTESPAPLALSELWQLPSICRPRDAFEDLLALVFIANRGNCAHLHFDSDHRQVLLHQLFGRKRVILIPPSASHLLHPTLNFSSINLESFSDGDREAFLRAAGAWQTVLEPGETLFIPMLMWHFTSYLETGGGFALRFGRNRWGRLLCGTYFHPDMYLQAIGWQMIDEEGAAARYADQLGQLHAALGAPHPTPFDRYRAVRELLARLYAQICGRHPERNYYRFEVESLEEAMVRDRIAQSTLYAATPVLDRAPRASSAEQQAEIAALAERRGAGTPLQELVQRRFGRPDVTMLSANEATLLARLLRAPGEV